MSKDDDNMCEAYLKQEWLGGGFVISARGETTEDTIKLFREIKEEMLNECT